MRRKASLLFFFAPMALTLGRGPQHKSPVTERVALNKGVHGVDGWLRIVSDTRLTTEMKKRLWGVGWDGLESDDPLRKMLSTKPPVNAKLEIVDSRGQIIESDQLERPVAEIEGSLLPTSDTFLLTVDYSVGFGSYAGPSTSLVDVRNGKIIWLKAVDADSHKEEPITLPVTLKSDWKFVSTAGKRDILQVLCRPDFTGGKNDFNVEYVRYRFEDGRWIKFARTEKDIWESDEGFPSLTKFRRVPHSSSTL